MYLTKEAILTSQDLVNEDLYVPEWGGNVRIKTMTGTERDAFEESIYEMKKGTKGKIDMKNFRAKLLVRTLIDENGKLIFEEAADIEALGKKSSKALDRVFAKAQELNGIGAKEMEDMTGNSEASQ